MKLVAGPVQPAYWPWVRLDSSKNRRAQGPILLVLVFIEDPGQEFLDGDGFGIGAARQAEANLVLADGDFRVIIKVQVHLRLGSQFLALSESHAVDDDLL